MTNTPTQSVSPSEDDPPPPTNLSRNTALMALGTLMSRITGFGRIFALGYALSYQGLSDTYNIANNAPNIIYELVVGGILAATVVPIFARHFATDSEDDAWRAVSAVLGAALAAVVVLSVALFALAPWIIHLYTLNAPVELRNEEREVGTFLLRLFAPQVAIYGFISVATGVLHARRRFAAPMFAPILNNLIVIFVLLSLSQFANDVSLEAMQNNTGALLYLGIGTTIGVLAMGIVLIPYLRATAKGRLRLTWEPGHNAVRTMLRMSTWTIGFVVANQISWWVMTVLASGEAGSFSAFFAAYNFFILPHAIVAVSVMSALQPELAQSWTDGNLARFRSHFMLGIRVITFVMLPAGVGYALLAQPIVSTILEHGLLSSSAADITAQTLAAMAVGLPGFSAFLYVTRAFQAMQDARTVFFLYVLQNGVNVATAFAFYPSMGVWGLGLSQSVAYAVAAVGGVLVLRSRTQGLGANVFSSLFRMAIATTVMAATVAGVAHVLRHNAVLEVVSAILAGAIVYVGSARILRLPELRALIRRNPKAAL